MRANTSSDGSEPSNVLCSSCRAQQRRRGRPPCRRQARTRDRAVTACALSHGTIAARGARPRPAAYQPALRVKFTMKVCKRTQQRWSGLLSCALSSKCVLPSVTHCGPTLSRTPTRATSTPSYVPSVALLSVALIGLNVNRLRYPIRSVAQLLYKSEYISHMQCAVRTRAPGPASRPRRASANQPLLARRRQSSSTRTSRSADGRMRVG